MSEHQEAGAGRPEKAGRGPSLKQSLGLDRHPLTRGKIALLSGAVAMMALGVALTLSAPPSASVARSAAEPGVTTGETGAGGLLGSGFAESRPTPPAAEAPAPAPDAGSLALHDLSPFMLKGGFGLFIGFAIGFAIRAFLRLAAVITGFYFLVLSMMAYAGWVDIHWDLMSQQFSHLTATLGAQFESLKTFLTGAIPASGLTVAGLVAGLRRK